MPTNTNNENEELFNDSITYIEESEPILASDKPSLNRNNLSLKEKGLVPTKVKQTREQTRGTLALIFIIGFFLMLIMGGLIVALNDGGIEEKVKHLQDVFLSISGVLSGPLGFVVGYYFRKQEEITSSSI